MNEDKKKPRILNKFPAFSRLGSANTNGTKCNENECKISDITKEWTQDIITLKLQKESTKD